MEIGAEKTKLMLNSASDIQSKIKLKGQKLGTVTNFKYLGTVVLMMSQNQRYSQGLRKPQLTLFLRDNTISFGSKVELTSLVISIFLYVC